MAAYPPADGSVLLSAAVDFHLEFNPSSPAYVYVEGHSDSDEPVVITYLEFARACHRAAQSIQPSPSQLFHDPTSRPVIAIIAQCDTIVYQALMLGVHKAGSIPFPISPRNSPAAVARLLKATSCHRVISTLSSLEPLLSGLSAELREQDGDYVLDIKEIPSLRTLYPKLGTETAEDPFIPYTTSLTRPDLYSIALYLHSSGSTGFPKVVPLTENNIVQWAALPSVTDFITCGYPALLGAMALPSFHTLGIYTQVLVPLFAGKPVAVYPPTRHEETCLPIMPTPDNILAHTRKAKCDGLMVIPTLLKIWSHSAASMEFLKSLRIVTYAGGSLSPRSGEILAAHGVCIRPIYGGTEFGAPSHWVPTGGNTSADEWKWIDLSSGSNVSMVPQGNGTYELQFLRGDVDHINVFNLPDGSGYGTSDIFEKHPTKPGLWKIVGRKDDVIVHATGEKTVPGPLEDIIASHAMVRGAVIFGERQSQPGVLIELTDETQYPRNDKELESIRANLWSIIEEANNVAPAFSRIYKDMILIASHDKPLPRAGKGTVLRKATLNVYDKEIQGLYDTIEAGNQTTPISAPDFWSSESLQKWLVRQASDLIPDKTLSPSLDLFSQGFDSLSATLLRHRIATSLHAHKDPSLTVPQTFVYDFPTLERLSVAVADVVSRSPLPVNDKVALVESMITKTISQFEPLQQSPLPHPPPTDSVVLLTGSTGGLGAYVLSGLLKHPSAPHVYTLDRIGQKPVKQRQEEALAHRGLDISVLDSDKLVSLQGDLTQADLGLGNATYQQLRESLTIIIHNAWTLDFNLPLAAFEPLIIGTRNLINIARKGPRPSSTRFLFTSSISAAQSWNQDALVPEDILPDAKVSIGTGYGESKYVAERILAESGLRSCSLRIGQVSGGLPVGAWSVTDWVPILVKSSIPVKSLPDAIGTVSWVPMDVVAQAVLDAAFTDRPLPRVMNVTHPRPVPWTTVFTALREHLDIALRIDLPLTPFEMWFTDIVEYAGISKGLDAERLPALKLLPFFEKFKLVNNGLTEHDDSYGFSFDTKVAQEVCTALRDAKQLGELDVSRWVGYWNSVGLFT